MQKLTVIKARALLQDLSGLRTIREELFRQALEIALPILEQQERGEGEWIEWGGGLVPPVTGIVEVRYRNGQEHSGSKAGDYSWARGLGGLTIIAYRVVKP